MPDLRLRPAHPLPPPGAPVPSKRAVFARGLDALGLLDRFLWLRSHVPGPALTVLTYHRVTSISALGDLEQGVVEVDAEGFQRHLDVIRAYRRIVTLHDVERFCQGHPLPHGALLLTFDDGYADSHDQVLPILRRAGVPATFFIPTAYPQSGRLFWWDRVALIMRRCTRDHVEIDYPVRMHLEPRRDPDAAARRICRLIKRMHGVDLARLGEELERATGVVLGAAEERAIADRTILTWRQVRALRAAGMDVQSHSHEHRVIDTLTPDEAARDLSTSRRILEDILGERVRAVAYPVGYRLHGAYRRAVESAGFEMGFTNNSGVCAPGRPDPLDIPRLAMSPEHVGSALKLLLLIGERPNAHAIK